ncbi:hypothetical protein D5125_17025 [Magnetovirga frankeli]|uniref:hypothetical protein n=1 Tax=Magnetovirga frankeli TaxID=947516 RepID=UPI001293D854|nr:hypothetical protein D5125_17025 [gamma proteobacterium SS-5]
MASLPAIRLRQLQQRHHQLQQQHRQLEIRHETLRLEHQRQIRHHQRVGQRIARRSILAIGRNLAAAPLEAVPVLGWAALAGGLALDIRDACLSLRDLGQELPPGCDLVE